MPDLATDDPPLLGSVLASRYEIRALLGRGGMGEVYEAVDRSLDRTVAVKVLRRDLAVDRRLLARFRREARTTARLSHPGIVAVHDAGEHDGRTFLVMELVPGATLAEVARDRAPLAPAAAARIVATAARALDHAHERGIVHRDVSPGNVMITPGGEVKVLDFGIAHAALWSAAAASPAGHGTVAYVAPEQLRGEPADRRADVYGLGAVLFELLTGAPPSAGRPPAPSALAPGVTPDLDRIVLRCLAARPRDRFLRASDVADALEAAASEAPDVTEPVAIAVTDRGPRTMPLPVLATRPLPDRGPRGPRRLGRAVAALAGAAVVLGGAAVAVPSLLSLSRRAERLPRPVRPPSDLALEATCDGWLAAGITLTWSPGGPSDGYAIYRKGPPGIGFELVATVAGWRTTTYRDADLAVGSSYSYYVQAIDGDHRSRPTAEIETGTPLLCLT